MIPAVATKKSFREYFSSVLEVLRPFLVDTLPADQLPLQVQTFGSLHIDSDERDFLVGFFSLRVIYFQIRWVPYSRVCM